MDHDLTQLQFLIPKPHGSRSRSRLDPATLLGDPGHDPTSDSLQFLRPGAPPPCRPQPAPALPQLPDTESRTLPHHCRAPAVPSARARRPRARSPTWRRGHERGGRTRRLRAGPHRGRAPRSAGAGCRARAAPPSRGASRAGTADARQAHPLRARVAVSSPERGPSPPGRASEHRRAVRARGPPCRRSVLACARLSGRRRPAARSPTRLGLREPAGRGMGRTGSGRRGGRERVGALGEGGVGRGRGLGHVTKRPRERGAERAPARLGADFEPGYEIVCLLAL